MSKIHNCIFQIQISPWRAALRKKLFWTFLLQISQLKNDQNFTLLRPPLQHFPQKNHKKIQKNYICFSLVKIWAVLHHLKKEWILFTMKWARNDFLHLWISKMSIDMGKRIVQCTPSTGNLKRATTTRIWNSAVNHMLEARTKALCTLTASTFAEKNKCKYVVLVSCVCIFKLAVKRN